MPLISLVAAALAGASPTAPATSNPDAAAQLTAAERALAAKALNDGFNEALAAFIADDGIIFRPAPVNGKKWLERPEPFPAKLDWWPKRVDVSCDGTLGWSTGPVVRDGNPARSDYVTVWRKEKDGQWRFVFDQGNPHPPEADIYDRTNAPKTASRDYCARIGALSKERALADMFESDRAYSVAGKSGQSQAGEKWLSDDSHVNRFFHSAPPSKPEAVAYLASQPALIDASRLGGEVAASGDFGFTYGDLSWNEGARGVQKGYYFRVWRREEHGWRLVLDQIRPLDPPPPPKP